MTNQESNTFLQNRLAQINNQIRQMDQKLGIEKQDDIKQEKPNHNQNKKQKENINFKQIKMKNNKLKRKERSESVDRVLLLYANGKNKMKYREQLQKERDEERESLEISACTFSPMINPKSRSYSAHCRPLLERSHDVLIRKTQRIIDHQQKSQELELNQCTFKPKISIKSQQVAHRLIQQSGLTNYYQRELHHQKVKEEKIQEKEHSLYSTLISFKQPTHSQCNSFITQQKDLTERLSTPKHKRTNNNYSSITYQNEISQTPSKPFLKSILKNSNRKQQQQQQSESASKNIKIQENSQSKSISDIFDELKQSLLSQTKSQKLIKFNQDLLKQETVKSQIINESRTNRMLHEESKRSHHCIQSLRTFKGINLQEIPKNFVKWNDQQELCRRKLGKYDQLIKRSQQATMQFQINNMK